jgi:hypothetical protein
LIKHRLIRCGYHAGDTQDLTGYVQPDRLSALRRLVNCGVAQTNWRRFVPWQCQYGDWQCDHVPPSAKLGVLRCGVTNSGSVFVLPIGPGFRFQHEVVIQKLGAARRHCPDLPFHATSLVSRWSTNRARFRLPCEIAEGRRRARSVQQCRRAKLACLRTLRVRFGLTTRTRSPIAFFAYKTIALPLGWLAQIPARNGHAWHGPD